MSATATSKRRVTARDKLLEAALTLIRQKGYSATTVDDLCAAAGVTKGAFFHHFDSKEALGVAAAEFWSEMTGGLFAGAPYHEPADPLERFLAYIDFRLEILEGELHEFTCLVGTMAQEVYGQSEAITRACGDSITGHAQTLEADIRAAMTDRGITADWTPKSLALHTQAVLQGAFILAKATGDADIARDMVSHLRRYVELLFSQQNSKGDTR
ncbi:TetR/AcrR family transcriptional regulator [Parvularcula marina]|uniref:TetR/AcrR family transcriptional regulator n=1 Tax=Parvularcula marina TaxID=2292771 RepID=UPI0035161222